MEFQSKLDLHPGHWFNIKMTSYQYRKSHCGDKTILRPSYLRNGISNTGKMTSLYWIRALETMSSTDGRMDGQGESGIPPPTFSSRWAGGYKDPVMMGTTCTGSNSETHLGRTHTKWDGKVLHNLTNEKYWKITTNTSKFTTGLDIFKYFCLPDIKKKSQCRLYMFYKTT